MTQEQINEILENAYIPEEWREHCHVTEDGMIFTPLFNELDEMIKTGEVVYTEWLANKDKPPVVEPTDKEKIAVLEAQVTGLEDELMMTNIYMTDLELEVFELKTMMTQQ